MARLLRRHRRIGITGIGNAGKSVLLTSLLAQMENHDPQRMPIGRGGQAEIRRFRILPPPSDLPALDYEGGRRVMVDRGRWPSKSRDVAHAVCRFERSDWRQTELELHFFDFPGERMADAGMLERDYASWSDAIIGPLRSDAGTAALAPEFLEVLDVPRPAAVDVVAAWKLALARFALAYRPLVTPSTFLLGPDGSMAGGKDPAAIATARFSGISGREMAPLPGSLRERAPELYWTFAERYEDYRGEVVAPVFRFLRRCHRLVVLVDIPGILMGGTSRYNDHRAILRALFRAMDDNRGLARRLTGAMSRALSGDRFRPGGISRVALVASKGDLVAPVDRTRTLMLLREMARRLAEESPSWRSEYFLASAVVSTQAVPAQDRALVGQLVFDATGRILPPNASPRRFDVPKVPDVWPEDWPAGEYVFPEVYPHVPRRTDLPPRQLGLGAILDFIVKEEMLE